MKQGPVVASLLIALFSLTGFVAPARGAAATKPASGLRGMEMPVPEGSANFEPTRQAFTPDHQFLVKLLSLPTPIPFEKYFQLRFAVYDGHEPTRQITGATMEVFAGMRHGLKHGFAHGMQSSPRVESKGGVFTVSGMYFHMRGHWVLKITVRKGPKKGTAYFHLPCCGR
jgi:hypothetical protein